MKSRKLVLAVGLVVSLCLIGIADESSVTINATVPAYVEVSFGAPAHSSLQVLPPASGTIYGKNTTSIPIDVTANCGFKLDLYENLPSVIKDLVGAADYTPFWEGAADTDGFVWNTWLTIVPESHRGIPGAVAFATPSDFLSTPGVGTGLYTTLSAAYGDPMTYSGGSLLHYGHFTMYAIVGVSTTDATVGEFTWTDLQAGSEPNFTVYAQISSI